MKSEVHGTITLDVSTVVESESAALGILEANYNYNNLRISPDEFKDVSGKLHNLKVHNIEIDWERYFGKDES